MWFSLAILAATVVAAVTLVYGLRKIGSLDETSPLNSDNPPKVSIIIPALNEAHTIEPALRSVLALQYPNLEVVAINDRSTDGTGKILDHLAVEFPNLRVQHVDELPAGWLGKNHALYVGAECAGGDYLLFTDADVNYEPTALSRAVAYCEMHSLDHLTLVPNVPSRSLFVQMSTASGMVGMVAIYQVWRARKSRKHYLGIGAFNMVRTSAYRAVGGHKVLAMEVLDDICLGRLMGRKGFRQDILLAPTLVFVAIYGSALEMLHGLRKNTFAFLDYSLLKLLAGSAGLFAIAIWPWIGIFMLDGSARWFNIITIALGFAMTAIILRRLRQRVTAVIYWPLNGLATLYILWQSAILAWINNGIIWRGTLYPLADLKRFHQHYAQSPPQA